MFRTVGAGRWQVHGPYLADDGKLAAHDEGGTDVNGRMVISDILVSENASIYSMIQL